jgi:hypothetical protein
MVRETRLRGFRGRGRFRRGFNRPVIPHGTAKNTLPFLPAIGYTVAASHHAEPLEEKPMTTPQVFVSHNHNDNDYCRAFVEALRQALGDAHDAVWYDEHNLGWGALQQVIDQELLKRQHFIAILSPNAVASDWVKTEIYAALELLRKGKMRTFQLVMAEFCDVSAVSPTLGGYKRIEQPGGGPVPQQDADMREYRLIL